MIEKLNKFFLFSLLFVSVVSFICLEVLSLPESGLFYFRGLFIFWAVIYLGYRFSKQGRISVPSFVIVLFFYVIYRFIWTFFNGAFAQYGIITLFHLKALQFLLVALIVMNTDFGEEYIGYTVKIFKITCIIAVTVSIVQVFVPGFLVPEGAGSFHRIGTIYTERRPSFFVYEEGNSIGLTFLPLFSLLLSYQILKRHSVLLYVCLAGIVAVLSNARYIMIGYFLVLGQLFFYRGRNLFKRTFYLFATIVVLIGILEIIGYDFGSFYKERLFKEGSITETTRYVALLAFLEYFPDNPVFGEGIRLTREHIPMLRDMILGFSSYEIHVGYLSHLVSYGIVGSFLFFSGLYLMVKHLAINAKQTGFYGSLFGFLVYIWSQFTFVQFSLFYYGIIYCFIFDRYYSSQVHSPAEQG